jgi:hypothetical protein
LIAAWPPFASRRPSPPRPTTSGTRCATSARCTRLAPGFAVDTRLDGRDRLVTFFTGNVLRERLITSDDEARRLVWSVVDGPYEHHNGAAQVFDAGDGATRFVWTADLLPDEAAPRTRELMQRGAETIRQALESAR